MGNLGWTEMFFIVAFALMVFGPRKLPEIAKTLGHAMAQLRRASEEFKRTWEVEVEREETIKEETSPAVQSEADQSEVESSANPYDNLIPNPEGTEPSTLLGKADSGVKSEEDRPVTIA